MDIEFIDTHPNRIVEDVDPDPEMVREESTLDTLYRVSAPVLPDRAPPGAPPDYLDRNPKYVIMTNYLGPPPDYVNVIHSGFPLWWPKQTQAKQLVDYVLQTLWGLTPRQWPGDADPYLVNRAAVSIPRPQPSELPSRGEIRRVPKQGAADPLPRPSRPGPQDRDETRSVNRP